MQLKEVNSSGVAIVQVPRGVNFETQEDPKVVTVLFGIAGLGDEHLEIIQKSQSSVQTWIML